MVSPNPSLNINNHPEIEDPKRHQNGKEPAIIWEQLLRQSEPPTTAGRQLFRRFATSSRVVCFQDKRLVIQTADENTRDRLTEFFNTRAGRSHINALLGEDGQVSINFVGSN